MNSEPSRNPESDETGETAIAPVVSNRDTGCNGIHDWPVRLSELSGHSSSNPRFSDDDGGAFCDLRLHQRQHPGRADLCIRAFPDTAFPACQASFQAFGPVPYLVVAANSSKPFVWLGLIVQKVAATTTRTKTVVVARDETG